MVAIVTLGGCSPGCLRGPINASPGLRWWLFANYGAQKICPELTKSGIGLKMAERGPSVGRFFPNQCRVEVHGDRNVVAVHFSGTGYAYTTLTRRVGFTSSASIEYFPDFRVVGEDDIYAWGRVNRITSGPTFRLGYVENPVTDTVTAVTPLGNVANLFGNQIATGELTRGFTVVHEWDTQTNTFSLGLLTPPAKPHTPFDVGSDELHTFANETTEVHANQLDFLGPFEIVDSDQYLRLRFFLQGPNVDVLVVNRQTGDMWRDKYQTSNTLGPPPGPVLAQAPLIGGQQMQLPYRLPRGSYFVVIDNSAYNGTMAPPIMPLNPLSDPVARISYVAQLVED